MLETGQRLIAELRLAGGLHRQQGDGRIVAVALFRGRRGVSAELAPQR